MGFFDQHATVVRRREQPRPREVWMQPQAALPGIVPVEQVVGRSAEAAVALTLIQAYPHGFQFTVSAILREDPRHRVDIGIADYRGGTDDGRVPDELLCVGVQFADGRAASNLRIQPPDTPTDPGPIMLNSGGNGGMRRHDVTYWVWPLPPPGPLAFVCQWPATGIAESRISLDAQLVLNASTRASQLWPEGPPARHATTTRG